ncbi:HpcH/HpaI aldolase family protein [Leptospira biflexa]|uniref:HpcH/HpaI aldolase family protein n=1 Tax=Leptospira biflexa TaxID=172 RepID=UPI001084366C|nr:aldolase/citrate lyase family protein [Leptospira biflexa]TGM31730.1 2,4-dihydroxyhept-2-ene-1,7-dioic acid aldolase [Leptospira biflexa]TGM39111.1 2,4-dihydroxyhept-2-ene-1,7-dioic acid aldolase [Leptospira biflexa]
MNRLEAIKKIRNKLKAGNISIGSWIQIPHPSVAEILAHAGYDWVAVDMEHGSISVNQLPDLFRALELGNTLPLARIKEVSLSNCKEALDAGAGGLILPMIEDDVQVKNAISWSHWPPSGNRGVGFSRANLFGKYFDDYKQEANSPLIIPMIESWKAIDSLEKILTECSVDAIMVGPYDLSASLGDAGNFETEIFKKSLNRIFSICIEKNVPFGIHVVTPNEDDLNLKIQEGFRWIAYGIDSVFLNHSSSILNFKRKIGILNE